jgi:hypothetical protein
MISLHNFPRLSLAEEVPPLVDFWMIYNRIPDDESKKLFLAAHVWTLRMIVDSWSLPYENEKLELLKSFCEHLGFDFAKVWTAQAARIYYQNIFSREIVNPRNIYEQSMSYRSLVPGVKHMQTMHMREDERLRQEFPGYKRFSLLFDNFWASVARSMQAGDQTIIALSRQWKFLEAESIKHDLKLLGNHSYTAFKTVSCQFCYRFFRVERSRGVTKTARHCEFLECRKIYDRMKPSKVERTALLGWISAGSKKRCASCKAVRLVNTEKICKTCFSENLSE